MIRESPFGLREDIRTDFLKERAKDGSTWSREHLAERIDEILEAYAAVDSQTKKAAGFLKEKAVVNEPPRLALDYAIEVLAHTHAYLTAREISERMQENGYEPQGEYPEHYVGKILRENPRLFAKYSWRQWGFPLCGDLVARGCSWRT